MEHLSELARRSAAFVAARQRRYLGPATEGGLRLGVIGDARPVIQARHGFEWMQTSASEADKDAWAAFLKEEEEIRPTLQQALRAESAAFPELREIIPLVTTAADYALELPVPPKGAAPLPAEILRMLELPQRPPPLLTAWLTRLPQQAAPPGFDRSFYYSEIVALWGRRMIRATINAKASRDFDLWIKSESDLKRPASLFLGGDVFLYIKGPDGESNRADPVIWERSQAHSDYHLANS